MENIINQKKRMLPLIILADTSGSMYDCIDDLNKAVKNMINSFKEAKSFKAEIYVSLVTFGGTANLLFPLLPASNIIIDNTEGLTAGGMTPLGGALKLAKGIIEDRNEIPSNAYRPTVVLLSDGGPNDDWEKEFNSFINEGRSKKCDRLALGIGNGYIQDILEEFSNQPNNKIFEAKDSESIIEFFKFVTMTMTEKSVSSNPNKSNHDMEDLFANITSPTKSDNKLGKSILLNTNIEETKSCSEEVKQEEDLFNF